MTQPDTTEAPRTQGLNRDYADVISKLLAKAESVAGTPEADAFMARATQLMMKYQIDETMIAAARGLRGTGKPEEVIEFDIPYTGIFKDTSMHIAFQVMRANNCKGFYSKNEYTEPKRVDVRIIGFESDVSNVKMMTTSLNLQCATAMSAWWKATGSDNYGWSKGTAYKAKREFIRGFASAAGIRLLAVRRAATAEAATSESERTGSSTAAARSGVELVLRDREESVKDWYDTRYGGSTRVRTSRQQSGGYGARVAGTTAGNNANIGGTAFNSNRKSLEN